MNNRVEIEYLSRVELTQDVTYEFELYWLKRPGMYLVDGTLGRKLSSVRMRAAVRLEGEFRLIKSIDEDGNLRLRVCRRSTGSPIRVRVFPVLPPDSNDPVLAEVFGATAIRNGIYREAARVVQHRDSKILESVNALTPLLDYSFSSSDAGLESWMCATEGNFTLATGEAANRRSDLLGERPAIFQLPIHMPFLCRRESHNPAAALTSARVEAQVENIHGVAINVHRPKDEPLEHQLTAAALLAQSDPHKHPFTTWMRAPGPRSSLYKPAYHAISRAVQTVLRQHLRQTWEQSIARSVHPLEASSISVYEDSRPWIGHSRIDFSYDAWCPASMNLFFKSASATSSRKTLAPIQIRSRFLKSILVAEHQAIHSLINLGIRCHEITSLQATNPAEATKQISIFARRWVKSYHLSLKSVLPGLDCSPLAGILLTEATEALRESLTPRDSLSAIFRVA